MTSPLLTPARPLRSTRSRFLAVLVTVAVLGVGCGGSESDAGPSDDPAVSTDDSASSSGDSSGGGAESESAGGGVAASIPWTAPDGMDPTAIAMSPSGDQVAVAFSGAPTVEGTPIELVVYDASTGAEAWRVSIDSAGLSGLDTMVFLDAGVVEFRATLEGSSYVTYRDGAVVGEVAADPSEQCAQLLNGAVDAANEVAFTVIPQGFCRMDLSTGEHLAVGLSDLLGGAAAGLADSIRYDADGALVATFTDADFNPLVYVLDPATLALVDDSPGRTEPISTADVYEGQLEEGPYLARQSRVADSADGSTVALLQPGRIDVIAR